MIGLGRMGGNMVRRLMREGHQCVVYDQSADTIRAYEAEGATGAHTLREVVQKLKPPRHIWIMVPAGKPVDDTIAGLVPYMSPDDTIIDGGNSRWTDTKRRAAALQEQGFNMLDAGTSGGIWGLKVGYCLMIGGAEEAFRRAEPIFATLAPPDGYLHVGPNGAGHYVKMVHNGVEYGLLQAYGEGFEILHSSEYGSLLDLRKIAHLWNQGSVVRSWLLELAELAFERDPQLANIKGYVEDSGEGRWTVQEAIDHDVPAPVITTSLLQRFISREEENFSAKVIAALRNEFGGHAVKRV
jgi:6-phosphogluconate dehydrogenase